MTDAPPKGWALILDGGWHRCVQINGVLMTERYQDPQPAIEEAHRLYVPEPPAEEPFPEWGKTPRLNGHATQMLITEKIDGTNGLIQIIPKSPMEEIPAHSKMIYLESGEAFAVLAGSRTRWLEPGKGTDNFGFAAWVHEHAEELVKLGPGKHYGEWWGLGIQRGYAQTRKTFSLFRWWRPDRPPAVDGLDVVPTLYDGGIDVGQIEACKFMLSERGSVAAPGYNRPEGLIVWMGGQRWKLVMDK